MSTQINQFLMWGIRLPYEWHTEWKENHGKPDEFCDHFEDFMDDSAFESTVKHKDGIFCLFDGRDGRFIIIGRVIAKAGEGEFLGSEQPICFDDPSPLEAELLRNSVERNFGATGEFRHWFVTVYR